VQTKIKAEDTPKGVSIIAREFSPAPPQPTIINEVRQKTSQDTNQELLLVKRIDELEATENDLTKAKGASDNEEDSDAIKKEIEEVQAEIKELEKELEKVQSKIGEMQEREIQEQALQLSKLLNKEIEQGTLEIETNTDSFLIRIKDKGAFPAGTARLTDDFIDVLEVVKKELSKIKGGIIVAGHTDNLPINTRAFRSNWDLSAERSVSVVQELLYESKLDPKRISIQAFAESRPLVDNKTAENRSKNRRVEIIISKSKKDELDSLDESGNSKEDSDDTGDEQTGDENKAEEKAKPEAKIRQRPKLKPEPKARNNLNENRRPQPDVNDIFNPDAGNEEGKSFINF
jgi:chemotaxis protein MotB